MGSERLYKMANFIEFKNVKKIYKMGEVEIEALAGVDFTINKGEIVRDDKKGGYDCEI